MDDTERRAALERHWEYSGRDEDIAHEIYHDDAVLEFPQSGERFVGVENFREWRRNYPATLDFEIRRIRGGGDFWVAENSISYDGGPWMYTVSILEFRGDRVARESVYVTEGWQPPEWRAPWRAAPEAPC
jgi:SnoaL-like protein